MANRSRKHQAELDNRERRLLVLAQCRQEGKTLLEYAEEVGVHYQTAKADKRYFMERQKEQVGAAMEVAFVEQMAWLAELRAELASVTKPDRRIELALGIIDRLMKLTGTSQEKTKVEITGLQLDDLTLEVRQLLFDLPEAERVKVRDYAKSLVPPVTIDADCFSAPEVNKQLTDGGDDKL